MNQRFLASAEFKTWSQTKLWAIVNDFPESKKDQTKMIEELKILLGAYDPRLPDFY